MNLKAFLIAGSLLVPTIASAESPTPPAAGAKADAKTAAKLVEGDLAIAAHVKHVNDMEIQMGKLAQANGTAAVKTYGAMLVKDHTANNTKLTAMAKKKGTAKITVPAPATEAEKADHQKMMDGMAKLKTLKGAEFDTQFLTMMEADHTKTVSDLTAAQSTAKDADLVAFIGETKPVVQGHADKAKELQAKGATGAKTAPSADGTKTAPVTK